MEIDITADDKGTIAALTGRLDTNTAPQLEEALAGLDPAGSLLLDFGALSYLSSAGLRVLLAAHKRFAKSGGGLTIRRANESVLDVFEMTGFSDILNLE